jgi:hypothetical protein
MAMPYRVTFMLKKIIPPRRSAIEFPSVGEALQGSIYAAGILALVWVPLMQRLRDEAAGLNTPARGGREDAPGRR